MFTKLVLVISSLNSKRKSLAAAEIAFWQEFSTRFDFIAVDYLVYTHEVIGNIVESYPLGWWLAAVAAGCVILWRWTWPRACRQQAGSLARWGIAAVLAAAIAGGTAYLNIQPNCTG